MQTLDYDPSVHTTPNAGDESLLVKFFVQAEQDATASLAAGRPIFRDREFIDIRIPGSRDNIVIRKARETDKQRFPRHYMAFKQRQGNDAETVVGTPLEMWPILTRSQVEEFKFFNIRTIEQLAAASDAVGQKFVGFQALKQRATTFIEAASAAAPISQMQEQINDLRAQLNAALARIEELSDD